MKNVVTSVRACVLSVVSALAVGCGAGGPSEGTATTSGAEGAGVDPAAGIDTSLATTGIVEANDITGAFGGSTTQASFGHGGTQVGLGKKLGSAGGCDLYAVPATAPGGYSAGVITLTTSKATTTLTPVGTAPRVKYSGSPATNPFALGAVDFSAAGGPDVGAFSASVSTPAVIAGFTPPTSLSRSAPWNVTWTAASSSHVAVIVDAFELADGGGLAAQDVLRCQTTDTGSFKVPAAALALVPSSLNYADVLLIRTRQSIQTVGTWSVHLNVNRIYEAQTISFN